MSSQTTNLKLVKQDGNEYGDNDITNSNLDIIDDEIGKRGKTVNGVSADDNGNYQINEVPFARQIITDDLQQSSAEYIERTTGGSISIGNGEAKLVSILGRSVHTGVVEESLSMTVNTVEREEGEPITATIDRDTFVEYVDESGTITLEYTDAWSANPTLYGVTVSGEPVEGDTIVIVYVKANRGLITNSTPGKFISTGWNLYNHSKGYARVLKYSAQYGFMVGGTYSTIKFSATLDGTKTTITPVDGKFTIPSDGYVWITGGNATSTYIIMTWSDWTSGPSGTFQAYTESVINLATIMTNFPYGMMSVGGTADEIDFSTGVAISRIERMAYSAENVAAAEASGRAWDADENYIYIVKAEADTYSTTISGDYSANDHGMETIEGTTVPVFAQTLYGSNLVDKLRTDVVTKSQDLVDNLNQTTSGKALDARQGNVLGDSVASLHQKYFSLDTAPDIPNNSNFNSLSTPGCYRVRSYSSATTMTNIPETTAGVLYVKNAMLEHGANYRQQIYHTYQNKIYMRLSSDAGSTWTTWENIVLSDFATFKTAPADAVLTTWIEQNAPIKGVMWFYPGYITDETQIPADSSGGNTYRWYSFGRTIRLNTNVLTVELIPYANEHAPVLYRYRNANGWGNWTVREQSNVAVRKIKTYSNITIPSSGYVLIDNLAGIVNGDDRVNSYWYVSSMMISGWNGATLPINIAKGTNRTDFYVIGQQQTISSLTVEYFLLNNNNVLS